MLQGCLSTLKDVVLDQLLFSQNVTVENKPYDMMCTDSFFCV